MNLLIKIPLSITDSFAGDFLEAQQNITDLFFRDLIDTKRMSLIDTFSRNYPGTPEKLEAVRKIITQEINLIETAMKNKSIELVVDEA